MVGRAGQEIQSPRGSGRQPADRSSSPGYAMCKSACQRPEQVLRFEQALTDVTGQTIRVEFKLLEEPRGAGRRRRPGRCVAASAAHGGGQAIRWSAGRASCSAPNRCAVEKDEGWNRINAREDCRPSCFTRSYVSRFWQLRHLEAGQRVQRAVGEAQRRAEEPARPRGPPAAAWWRSRSTACWKCCAARSIRNSSPRATANCWKTCSWRP